MEVLESGGPPAGWREERGECRNSGGVVFAGLEPAVGYDGKNERQRERDG